MAKHYYYYFFSFIGENVADDEEKTLAEFGLHDSCTLFLELGKVASSQRITLHAAAITGNDVTTVKVNPYQPGKRSAEVVLDVSPVSTVRDLRDRLGCLFHNLSPGWTLASPVSSQEQSANAMVESNQSTTHAPNPSFRLRRATLLGDGDTLLFEVGSKGEALTLTAAEISTGSMVLLEEGEVPIKGLLSFSLFLWSVVPFKPVEIGSETASECMGDDSPKDENATVGSAATTPVAMDVNAGDSGGGGMTVIDMTQVPASAPVQVVVDSKPEEVVAVERALAQHLLSLGDIVCHEDKFVSDLQSLVFKAITEMIPEKRAVAFHDGKWLTIKLFTIPSLFIVYPSPKNELLLYTSIIFYLHLYFHLYYYIF